MTHTYHKGLNYVQKYAFSNTEYDIKYFFKQLKHYQQSELELWKTEKHDSNYYR
jgi:hypothetical protein